MMIYLQKGSGIFRLGIGAFSERQFVGSTNFQPVMFDMDLFGGKKVPRDIKRRAALDFGSHVP